MWHVYSVLAEVIEWNVYAYVGDEDLFTVEIKVFL